MKRILSVLVLMCLEKTLHAQTPYVYTIKADSVKITNSCDTAELIIENHTQNVLGFLFNKGRGRTEFRRPLLKVNDSIYLVGVDTLRLHNAWVQGGNTFGTTGYFGTRDNNHIDFYTNGAQRMRLTNLGRLLINTTTDNGYEFQLKGRISLTDGIADIVSPRFKVLVGDQPSGGNLFNGDTTGKRLGIGMEHKNNFHKILFQTAGQPNDEIATYNFTYNGNMGNAFHFYSFIEGRTQLLLSAAGNLILGQTGDSGDKLQVNGTSWFGNNIYLSKVLASSSTSDSMLVVDNNGQVKKRSQSPTRKSATVTGASYSVPADIDVVFVNYAAGQATISLPTGTLDREITIKNLSTANTVIISGLDTNDSNSVATRGAITVKYTGSAWVGISKY